MSVAHALSALAALGQSTRLAIFRLLMQREPGGLPAGTLAQAISCPPNTLSSHLAILARAGLVRGVRNERSIIYRADIEGIRALISFLVTDCCNGHPELCDLGSRAAALVQRKDGDDGKPRRSEIIQRAVLVHGQLGALDRRARHPSRVNEVRTPGLVKLTAITVPDCEAMRDGFGRCSELLHSAAPALNRPVPRPEALTAEITALATCADDVRQR